jgi:hypothetical protein
MVKKESLGSEVYSGAAGFGRIYAWISAIIGTIIAIGMIIAGIYIINHKGHLKSVDGKVTKASYNCNTQTHDKDTTTTCKFDISYIVDSKTYTKTFSSTDKFSVDQTVTVWYDPNHPDQGEFNPLSKNVGSVLISSAIFITISVWLWVWLTRRYKFAAAAGGASSIFDMFKN